MQRADVQKIKKIKDKSLWSRYWQQCWRNIATGLDNKIDDYYLWQND